MIGGDDALTLAGEPTSPGPVPMAALPGFAPRGSFVAIVGPSGAGKDTLINLAREALAGDGRFLFPRRLVTRMPSCWEDHLRLDEMDFARGIEEGRFALHWHAHGLGYALPLATGEAVLAGAIVVANISRTQIAAARSRFAATKVVLVTAPPDVLALRLAGRGREQHADVAGRIGRNDAFPDPIAADVTIANVATPHEAAGTLVRFLRQLAPPASAGRAGGAPGAAAAAGIPAR